MTTVTELRGPRVLLRDWRDQDLAPFAALNAHPEVSRHLSRALSAAESDALAQRMCERLRRQGWGSYALEVPDLGFAGFIALTEPSFTIPLPGCDPPQVEIGWRLAHAAWGRGYATEGARMLLDFARDTLRLPRVISFTTLSNTRSMGVMERLGLIPVGDFDHPLLAGHPLQPHRLYATPPGWGSSVASGG
jgi:RimJ/RimL family protein N-acetyltransferase